MSGFFGVVRTDGEAVQQEFLDGMARSLEFRGPDGTNTWKKEGVGFCFTRLDTGTPHQARSQPVALAGRYWLVGEVRLDARRELVAELRGKDQPASKEITDEELLLQCWNVWGESALQRIAGDFSFGLWDAEKQSLCCARDFAGARPFYYAQGPGALYFSNTLQILRRVPGVSGQLDDFFIRDFLLEGQSSHPERTAWRGVRRLRPGHRLIFSSESPDVRRFLQLPIEEPLQLKQPEQYLENFRELLERAVADRLPQRKAALYLSGGLDSASVCATAARVAAQRGNPLDLKAFTVSWRMLLDDPEPEFAKLTAARLGLDHEIFQEDRILPDDGAQIWTTPEPTAELFFARACRMERRMASHSHVVLSGDGGDNVLDGYAWPYLNYLRARGNWGEIFQRLGGYVASRGQLPSLGAGFRTRLRQSFHSNTEPEGAPSWLNEDFYRRTLEPTVEAEASQDSLPVHPVHPHAYQGLHSGYWGGVLDEEDAGWAGIQLETRAPFLDLRLLKFLFRLPPVPWCMRKELTRQSMANLLPDEILRRPKTPLVESPLEACQQKSGWRPEVEKNPPKTLTEFVKWDSWLATLDNSKGLLSWEFLYPLSFARWVKAIEKGARIE
jgi:asparagine synthase (glutamine-hydrolysing)